MLEQLGGVVGLIALLSAVTALIAVIGCFFREVLLTLSSSPAICCASWIFSGFSAIKHV